MSSGAHRRAGRPSLVLLQLLVFVFYIFGPTGTLAEEPVADPSPTESAAPADPSPEPTTEPSAAPDPTVAPSEAAATPAPTEVPPAAPEPSDAPAPTEAPPAAPGTEPYLISFAAGTSVATQVAIIDAAGVTDVSAIPQLAVHSILLHADSVTSELAALRGNTEVVRVEADRTREVGAEPSDPSYADQWALPKVGWDQLYGTVGIGGTATVAILDTGVDAFHPDLDGVVLPGTSVFDGSDGRSDPNGHGTWMAGIVAAETGNADGIAGTAYAGVSILPVTVLGADGTGNDSDIIAGVVYAADAGADVILMSFSNPGFSSALQAAIDYAWASGAVLVAAAGNDGASATTFPAGDRSVIGVAATDPSDNLTLLSNYGPSTFMAAPGLDILTTDAGGSTSFISGTSASAAMVAGAAALLAANEPSLSNGVIVGRLARNADAAGDPAATGNGRLNLLRAMADTSTDAIQPAGAAPVGDGGPLVGPYVAATPLVNFDMAPTFVTGSGVRSFTLVVESLRSGGNAVGCIKVVVPIGYTISSSAVTESALSGSLVWGTPTVNTGTRTIQWSAGDAANDLEDGDWARITISATVPATATANWVVESWQNFDCTGGGGAMVSNSQAVRVGALADPQYTATFILPSSSPSITTGTAATYQVRITRTSGSVNVQSAFVVLPTCFTAVSAPTMVSGGGNNPGWAASRVDNTVRMDRGGPPTNNLEATGEFVTVQFSATASCPAATYSWPTAAANTATKGGSGSVATVINAAAALSMTVTSANNAPAATVPAFTPASPTTNTNLQASSTLTDADLNTISSTWVWSVTRGTWTCQVQSTSKAAVSSGTAVSDTLDLGQSFTTSNCTGTGFPSSANPSKGDTVSVAVTPNDGQVNGTTQSNSITILNSAPIADNKSASVGHLSSVGVDVTVSGSDADGDSLTFTLVGPNGGAAHGTVSLLGTTAHYTPTGDFVGTDTFSYRASDGPATSSAATVTVTLTNVAPASTVPAFTPGSPTTNTNLQASSTLADGDGDLISSTWVWKVTRGTWTCQVKSTAKAAVASGTSVSDTLDLSQAFTTSNCTGTGSPSSANPSKGDDISVTVTPNDGHVNGSAQGNSLTIGNTAPTATVNLTPASPTTNQMLTATATKADDDGDTVTLTFVWKNGTTVIQTTSNTSSLTDTLDLALAGNGNKGDTITVEVTPNDGTTNGAAATDSETVVNSAPVAVDDSKSTNEDEVLTFPPGDLTSNDTDDDGDTLIVTSVSSTATTHGAVEIVTDALDADFGKVRYTPAPNYNGPASFEYSISDGDGGTDTGTVTMTVNPINDAPVANDGTASMDEDAAAITIDLRSLVSDVETGDADLTYAIVAGPTAAAGTLTPVLGDNGKFSFDSAPNFNGTATFTYKVTDTGDPAGCSPVSTSCDAAEESAVKTVTITVNPINDKPTADHSPASPSTNEDTATTITVSGADVETADGALTFKITALPAHGSLKLGTTTLALNDTFIGSPQSLTYTPAADYNGPDSFKFTVTDTGDPAGCSSAPCSAALTSLEHTVNITVVPVNDAPTINSISDQVALTGVDLGVAMSGITEGPANEVAGQTLSVTATSSDTTVATVVVSYTPDSSTGSLTIKPKTTACGSTLITVTVKDSGGTANGGVDTTVETFTVSTFYGHFLAPLQEGARNLVQKGQVVPVKIDVGCPGSMSGLTPSIQLLKGDYTSDPEVDLVPIDPTVSVSNADTTGYMRAVDSMYIYNMLVPKTGDMTAGKELTIRVRPFATAADPNFGPMMQIVIEIRK